jgi:hypothetical protein
VFVAIWTVLAGVGFVAGVLPPLAGAEPDDSLSGTAEPGTVEPGTVEPGDASHVGEAETATAGQPTPSRREGSAEARFEPEPWKPTPEDAGSLRPTLGLGETPSPDAAARTLDAGTKRADDTSDAGTARDAGTDALADTGAPPSALPDRTRRALERFVVCDGRVRRPRIASVGILGDPRPEIAVACGPLVQLLAVLGRGDESQPLRVATLETEARGRTRHASSPAAGDMNGDSRPDLIVGFWDTRRGGSTRGGVLYQLPREKSGALGTPTRLAPIAVTGVALAQLDGKAGLDLVALNRGAPLARRSSEAWIFTGGPSPTKVAALESGMDGRALAVADVDGDGELDVLTAAADGDRIDAFYGDGTGQFPRSSTLSLPSPVELLAANLDDDDAMEIVVRAEGLHLVQGRGSSLKASPLDAPADAKAIRSADLDGDGRLDLLALDGRRILWLRQTSAGSFRLEVHSELPARWAGLQDLALGDFDADGSLDLAVLGRGATNDPWELVLLPRVRKSQAGTVSSEARPVSDAPLHLQIPLP